MTNEEVVRAYAEAVMRDDFAAMGRLRHPEWTTIWPQSGELVRGHENDIRIREAYPGGAPKLVAERLVGSEDRWVTSPLGGVYHLAGEGENWWGEWRMTYPDGRTWFTVTLLEIRDRKIYRETVYWSEPFDPPEWRAAFVEWVAPTTRGGDR